MLIIFYTFFPQRFGLWLKELLQNDMEGIRRLLMLTIVVKISTLKEQGLGVNPFSLMLNLNDSTGLSAYNTILTNFHLMILLLNFLACFYAFTSLLFMDTLMPEPVILLFSHVKPIGQVISHPKNMSTSFISISYRITCKQTVVMGPCQSMLPLLYYLPFSLFRLYDHSHHRGNLFLQPKINIPPYRGLFILFNAPKGSYPKAMYPLRPFTLP